MLLEAHRLTCPRDASVCLVPMVLKLRRSLAQPVAQNDLGKACSFVESGVRLQDSVIDTPVRGVEAHLQHAETLVDSLEQAAITLFAPAKILFRLLALCRLLHDGRDADVPTVDANGEEVFLPMAQVPRFRRCLAADLDPVPRLTRLEDLAPAAIEVLVIYEIGHEFVRSAPDVNVGRQTVDLCEPGIHMLESERAVPDPKTDRCAIEQRRQHGIRVGQFILHALLCGSGIRKADHAQWRPVCIEFDTATFGEPERRSFGAAEAMARRVRAIRRTQRGMDRGAESLAVRRMYGIHDVFKGLGLVCVFWQARMIARDAVDIVCLDVPFENDRRR